MTFLVERELRSRVPSAAVLEQDLSLHNERESR